MGRIQISDLPEDREISQEEMKKVNGGFNFSFYSIPWLTASMISSAITIPLALGDDDEPAS